MEKRVTSSLMTLLVFILTNFIILSLGLSEYSYLKPRLLVPEGQSTYRAESNITEYFGIESGNQNATNQTLILIATDVNPTKISSLQTESAKAPDMHIGFNGITSTDNSIWVHPPDVQIAVGPNHVVEFVNRKGRIFNKTTESTISTFELSNFFSVPSGDDSNFDPKIIYDGISGRFFATYVSYDDKTLLTDIVRLYIAVSTTNNPTESWKVYRLDINDDFPDYPGIGLTDDKVVISYNRFDIDTSDYTGVQTIVVEKNDLLAGTSSANTTLSSVDSNQFTWRPAHSLSSTSTQWMVSSGTSKIYLLSITGTPAERNVRFISVANISINQNLDSPPNAKQNGSTSTIDTNDNRVLEAVWMNNKLWLSANDGCVPNGDSVTRSCLRLIQIDTNSSSILTDLNYGTVNEYHYYPAIRPDLSNNLIMVYSSASDNKYVESRAVAIVNNSFTDSILLKLGEAIYTPSGYTSPYRWGDYLGAAVDPNNPAKIWVAGQHAKTPQNGDPSGGGWGTWIAQIAFSPSFVAQSEPLTAELGEFVTLSAFWSDDINLDKAILSTNETGVFKNYTSGNYGSPVTFNSNSGWSNFTWSNASLIHNDVVSWEIYVNNTNNIQNVTDTLSFKLIDTKGPLISNLTQSNDTTYQKNKTYNFTVTVSDYSRISHVIFEWNKSANITAYLYQPINSTTKIYGANTTDMSTGNYTYRWIANDTIGNQNSTSSFSFEITKNAPKVFLELNGTHSNTTIYGISNITAYTNDPVLVVNIFANFSGDIQLIKSGRDIQTNLTDTTKLAVGNYEIIANVSSNENYTNSQTVSLILTVPDVIFPTFNLVNNITPNIYDPNFISNFSLTWSDNVGISQRFIEENFTGILRNSTMNSTYSIILPVGVFQYRYLANDTANNWNATNISYLTINPQEITIYLAINGNESNQTLEYSDTINITGWKTVNESDLTLYRNGTELIVTEGNNSITNISTLSLGIYNYTIILNASNYTANLVTRLVTIQDTTSPSISKTEMTPRKIRQNHNVTFISRIIDFSEVAYAYLAGYNSTWYQIYAPQNLSNVSSLWYLTFNVSNVSNGLYYFNLTAVDTLGNNKTIWTSNLTINETSGANRVFTNSSVSTVNNKAVINTTENTNSTLEIRTKRDLSNVIVAISSYTENLGTANTGIPALNKYLEITTDSQLNESLSWAIITIYYNDSDVPSGYSESNLRIYYNAPNGDWIPYDSPNGDVNTSANYVWANTTHFSLFGVYVLPTCSDGIKNQDETGVDCGGSCSACSSPPPSSPPSGGSGGGGGGGGGGSVVSSSPTPTSIPKTTAIKTSETTVKTEEVPANKTMPISITEPNKTVEENKTIQQPKLPTGFATLVRPEFYPLISVIIVVPLLVLAYLYVKKFRKVNVKKR